MVLKQIERTLLRHHPEKNRAIILYGPRQAGKTTLVKHIIEKYPKKAKYMSCDYADVRDVFAYENSHKLKEVVRNLQLLVLDEAQRIENIGLVLKILVDDYPNVRVIATGSSSFDLSNKISEPLTGRKHEFLLFPFSFEELFQKELPHEQKRHLDFLLRFGSYPEIAEKNETEAEIYLKELTGSYLFKDVFTFQELKKPELLTKLLRLIAFQIGSEVSYHELAQKLGVDQTVIQRYLFLLEEAFVIFRLSALKRNLRNEVTKSRKIYFWDLGIRNSLIQNHNRLEFRNDIGALWENFCIAERMKYLNNHQKGVNHYFWRTYAQKEIDYIEEAGNTLCAYEFSWNHKKKRKLPKAFSESYKNSTFEVIHPENFQKFLLGNS
ncbi:ATP-binding protein [Candidatus Peregrinibacteria bacterium]|nr:ATP-binding protein [Candidatus Peregrinibacteria bacterium]